MKKNPAIQAKKIITEHKKRDLVRVNVAKGVWILTDNPDGAKERYEAKRNEISKADLTYSHFKPTPKLTEAQRAKQKERQERIKRGRANTF